MKCLRRLENNWCPEDNASGFSFCVRVWEEKSVDG